jgi:uncharacterized protein YkwD
LCVMLYIRRIVVVLFVGLLASPIGLVPKAPVAANPQDSGPPDSGPPGVVSSAVMEGQGGLSACYTGCGGTIAPAFDAMYEQQVIDLVNAERAARGLPPFKLASALRGSARYHAADMVQDDYFEHDSYDRVGERLERVCSLWARIATYYEGARAENIAAGYATPESVMEGWMESGGHRDSILSASYREMGVGYYGGGSWGHYWVQDFGLRDDVYPLVINREAATTDSVYVSLYLYGREWDEVRLRNDDGAWSSWRPFANSIDWRLPCRAGEHTVWAEMRAGERRVTSGDAISLLAAPALGGLPGEMRFVYSLPEGRLLPASVRVTPRNVGNDDPFTWQATVAEDRFRGSPLTGSDGDSFQIVPAGLDRIAVGTYTGAVTVVVNDLAGVDGSPQRIDLTLQVLDASLQAVYLPLILAGQPP